MTNRNRCAWVDPDGVRCPAPATFTRSTRGGGTGFCSGHAHCSSAVEGLRVIDQHVADGHVGPLTPHERRAVVRRMSPPGQGKNFDVQAAVRRREDADARRALAVYHAEFQVALNRNKSGEECHAIAIAAVYRAARRESLGMPAPRLSPADLRAGEVSE